MGEGGERLGFEIGKRSEGERNCEWLRVELWLLSNAF